MNRPLIIAHGANSAKKVRLLLKKVDLVEVDVAQNIFNGNFLLQHNGIFGKVGIGASIRPILGPKLQNKIMFDLKHPRWSINFADKFGQLVEDHQLKKIMIVSDHWQTISKLSKEYHFRSYYYLAEERDKQKFINFLPTCTYPEGIVAKSTVIDNRWMKKMQRYKLRVIAFLDKSDDEAKRLADLGIWAIIANLPDL